MRKAAFRPTSDTSHSWARSESEKIQSKNRHSKQAMITESEVSGEWLPESVLRDALIAERLPASVVGQNLFWVNIRQYLNHDDAQLPPDEYLRHWREIYRSCMNQDTAHLRGLSYVSIDGPINGSELN